MNKKERETIVRVLFEQLDMSSVSSWDMIQVMCGEFPSLKPVFDKAEADREAAIEDREGLVTLARELFFDETGEDDENVFLLRKGVYAKYIKLAKDYMEANQ